MLFTRMLETVCQRSIAPVCSSLATTNKTFLELFLTPTPDASGLSIFELVWNSIQGLTMKIFICEERLNLLFFDYCTKITVAFSFVNAVFDINRHYTYTSYMMAFNVMMKKPARSQDLPMTHS